MRQLFVLLILAFFAGAQSTPIRLDSFNLIPPATSVDGSAIVFAAAISPDGATQKGTDLYAFVQGASANSVRRLTNYSGVSSFTGVTSVAYAAGFAGFSALPSGPGGPEEVHLIDTASAADRTLATDKEGCIQPLCITCFRACLGSVHLSPDAARVFYAVARQQPFYVVNADGAGLKHLDVYQGSVAPSPQRIISRAGQVVFTSAAPFGPTFAAAATDVYTMNLDGTGIRPVTRFGDARFFAANATISADGSLIAFESNYSDSGPQTVNLIWVVRSDGTGLRSLSSGADSASNPSISADGSVVVFRQSGQLKRARTAGDGSVLTLTRLSTSTPQDPAVSEDGSRVAFTFGPQAGTIAAVYRIPADSTSDMRSFLGIYAPRLLNASGVGSAAGFGFPSQGSLISAYGVNLGLDDLSQATSFPLPISLNGLSLLVNGDAVPLLAVTPWQINAQLPQSALLKSVFQVSYSGGVRLPPVSVEIKNSYPELFSYRFVRGQLSYGQAAAFHAGTAVIADIDHPAEAGEALEIYGLGLGPTVPMVAAGVASPSSPPARAVEPPFVQIGLRNVPVDFAGLVPGLAGVYQVNAKVPTGLSPGLQWVSWGANGIFLAASIAVK